MLNKSIGYRLSIYISLAVIGVFLTFIVITFFFNLGVLKNNIENKATVLASEVLMKGEKQLVATREVTSNISEQLLYYAQNDDVKLFLENIMNRYPFFNAIIVNIDSTISGINYRNYYAFNDKDSIDFRKGNRSFVLCNVERKVFDEKIATGVAGWTKSFTCPRNNNHIISYYSPITIKDKNDELIIVGSVISELSLLELTDFVNTIEFEEFNDAEYIAIIDRDGRYLIHPNKEYILNKNLYSLPEAEGKFDSLLIYNMLNRGLSGTSVVYPDYVDNKKSWVYFTPIEETGWTLTFIIPFDELFVPLYVMILRMLFFAVLGILIIFFIVTYISGNLIKPLSSVTTELKKFSSRTGHISDTNDEVKLVSESLDYLQNWYNKFKVEKEEVEKKDSKRKQDLEEASNVQMSLINTDFSEFEKRNDIDLFALFKPAQIVSGDLYDFIFLDSENLFITIGDVSGKGVSAAFFMSVAQTLLKGNSRLRDPSKIVRATNHRLYSVNQHQFFLTLFCGILNLKTGVLTYCNAAHTPTIIVSPDGELNDLSKTHGMPLGLYPNRKFGQSSITLKEGSSIVLFSDGVTEQLNEKKRYFGINKFNRLLQKSLNLEPKKLAEKIEKRISKFKGEMSQTDDITIMVLKFKHKKRPD